MKFRENHLSDILAVPCEQTCKMSDMTKLTVTFCKFANAPNKCVSPCTLCGAHGEPHLWSSSVDLHYASILLIKTGIIHQITSYRIKKKLSNNSVADGRPQLSNLNSTAFFLYLYGICCPWRQSNPSAILLKSHLWNSSVFWVITQRGLVYNRRFVTKHRSHLQGSSYPRRRQSRNIGSKPTYAA